MTVNEASGARLAGGLVAVLTCGEAAGFAACLQLEAEWLSSGLREKDSAWGGSGGVGFAAGADDLATGEGSVFIRADTSSSVRAWRPCFQVMTQGRGPD